jgi:hypothetical protein
MKHSKMTNKIVQAGGDTFSPGDGDNSGVNEGEFANEAVLEKLPGYTSTRLWASNGQLTKANIARGFTDNVDFVDFSGHGSYHSWATHEAGTEDHVWLPPKSLISPYTGFLYIDFDLYQINNAYKFPVVVYNACSCHKYTGTPTSMGWSTVGRANGGGIASFGAAGIGYGSYGVTETERVFGWMEVHIFEELYNTKILGEVWNNAIVGYANSFELGMTDYKTLLEMSMFGDPTIIIDDGEEPKSNQIQKPVLSLFLYRLIDRYPILEQIFQKY